MQFYLQQNRLVWYMRYNTFALISPFLWPACLTHSPRSSPKEFSFSSVTYDIVTTKQDKYATLIKVGNIK